MTDQVVESGSEPVAWGLGDTEELVYRAVLRHPGRTRDELAGLIGRAYGEVVAAVRQLGRMGLIQAKGQALSARPPGEAFAELLDTARRELADREAHLSALRATLPAFLGDYAVGEHRLRTATVAPVEVIAGREAVDAMLADLSGHPAGELLSCVRPPMAPPGSVERRWSYTEPEFTANRPARTIYRADFFEHREWWQAVRGASARGANVRIATHVPTKLVVVTGYAAMVPLDFDTQDDNNGLLVREPALVNAFVELFELVWERGVSLTMLSNPAEAARGDSYQELLNLLAAGAKDETIARQLDVSLRTVRRHVASVLGGLDARTRFQAGVNAVRRGWL